jgi:hypothetical protein
MNLHNWIFVSFTKYLLHVSAFIAPSSSRTLITSKNICYCKVVAEAELHSVKHIICGTLTALFTIINTILARCYGLEVSVIANNFVKNPQVIDSMPCNSATLTTMQ